MTTNALILYTRNSARSVLSEGVLNHWVQKLDKDVRTYSVGSAPSGRLSLFALEVLTSAGTDTAGYCSKSWDEFVVNGVPQMRVVITVCDSAAAEQCLYWPGSPVKVHWGYVDPSNVPGSGEGKRQALEVTRQAIGHCMLQLLALSLDILSNAELQAQLERISQD